ncbi:hypothetical protein [Christensenella hongkongensis]|uniref:hypothetical protein n=1 Tax=Christensenella hongkongensis TaxID=270498 RepID=UPI000623B007|nr:hypothetical protein [Christensenella hongkongensis]TCW29526.1 hypothetical protein EV208_105166 [Christensenella hongkongensis]
MAKIKSFLKSISVDICARKHSCQHNPKHTIYKDDKRLKLKDGRTQEYFCIECAVNSIDKDIEKLKAIKKELLK